MPDTSPLAGWPRVARILDATTTIYERAVYSAGPLTPPWRIRRYVGPFGDPRVYERTAALQVEGLRLLGAVTASSGILDVGCGTGRLASALTSFLGTSARYEGLDPQSIPVRWCREHITAVYPQFYFQETGTFSPKYNPSGAVRPEEYRFPFADATFDLVLLLSVLTHVGRDVEESLLREGRRVLAPHGQIVLTEYLLDVETRRLVDAGLTEPRFPYAAGEDRTQTRDSPEGFIARDAEWVRSTWDRLGLAPITVRPGTWCGPQRPADPFTARYAYFQDTVALSHHHGGPPRP